MMQFYIDTSSFYQNSKEQFVMGNHSDVWYSGHIAQLFNVIVIMIYQACTLQPEEIQGVYVFRRESWYM